MQVAKTATECWLVINETGASLSLSLSPVRSLSFTPYKVWCDTIIIIITIIIIVVVRPILQHTHNIAERERVDLGGHCGKVMMRLHHKHLPASRVLFLVDNDDK